MFKNTHTVILTITFPHSFPLPKLSTLSGVDSCVSQEGKRSALRNAVGLTSQVGLRIDVTQWRIIGFVSSRRKIYDHTKGVDLRQNCQRFIPRLTSNHSVSSLCALAISSKLHLFEPILIKTKLIVVVSLTENRISNFLAIRSSLLPTTSRFTRYESGSRGLLW